MDFKYKIADVAKEFGVPAKKVIETVTGVTGEAYKTGGTFEEKELNVLLETLTRENAEASLDAYLASGKEPAPAPKAEKKPEPKPAPKAEKPAPKPEKPAQKPQKLSITTDDNTPRLVKAAPADFVPEKLEFERPPRRERSDRPRGDRPRRDRNDRH